MGEYYSSGLPPIGGVGGSYTPRSAGGIGGRSTPYALSLGAFDNSRPDSASSTGSVHKHSSYYRARTSNSCYADYCALKSPRSSGFCKLPSLRNTRRHTARVRHSSYPSSSNFTSRSPTLVRTSSEECIKCMLKIAHTKCEAHKYIRVGGGYRHSYWYLRTMLDEIEAKQAAEILRKQRLEAIQESGKTVRAIKTYIRTKSGRLIERIVFLSEEDYQAFKKGGSKAKDILGKYLSSDEVKNLDSWEKDEVKAIKTYVRTKSGRLIEKIVYVTKDDYELITKGGGDAKDILKKYVKPGDGETVEGWEEAQMKTIKTYVRTKSGRLVERTIVISKEDYDALIRDGGDPAKILAKYAAEGDVIEGWKKTEPKPMKVVKTYIRTKSGRLVEKTILMTEEEFEQFQKTGGDVNFLKKFMTLEKGEVIEDWEKASTVYEGSDDEEIMQDAEEGDRIIGKDGVIYEIVVDPVTGKKYKKRVDKGESDGDSGIGSLTKGKGTGKSTAKGIYDDISEEETAEQRKRRKDGGRIQGSDSEYSYRSIHSAGGTRHVTRRKKLGGGKYGDEESYHSSQDEDGKERRKGRRKERKKAAMGKRNPDSASEYSYKSERSAGGTRHVKRRRKRADGTYSDAESYHSSQDEGGKKRRAKRRQERKNKAAGRRNKDSDSDYSYRSVRSAGGTRHVKRKRKRKDGTYSDEESFHSSQDEEGAARRRRRRRERKHDEDSDHSYYSIVSVGGTRRVRRKKRNKDGTYGDSESYISTSSDEDGRKKKGKKKKKRRQHGSGSEFSYYSEVSAGGTRTRKRKRRIRDEHGNVIGHGKEEAYSSDSQSSYQTVSDGKGGKIKIRKSKDPAKKKKGGRKGGGANGDDSTDFSDCTTDSEAVARKMKNMTKEEKEIYLKERNERKKDREKKRKEKYGDKYDEIMEKHEKKKQEKKFKSMVDYGKGKARFGDEDYDERELGPGHDQWGKKGKKGKRDKDGNEADSESEEGEHGPDGRRRKKGGKGGKGGDSGSEYEYVTDAHGNLIKKKKKKKDGDSESEYEYEYDKHGNVIGKKKVKKKKDGADDSDGDYFEVGEDGKIRLKAGKKKIDISKLTDDDLRKLGIDPNLSKQEITKLLKEKFGDDIQIVQYGKKIGTKHIDDYGSDVNTDDLADDSDLDTSTLKGARRMNVIMRKGGQKLIDHMKKVIEQSKLRDDETVTTEKKDSHGIDYMQHYQLVEDNKIDTYARAFVCEDDRYRGFITEKSSRMAMEGIKSLERISKRQMDYVLKVLEVDEHTDVNFRIFALVAALAERVTKMDKHCQELLAVSNLTDIERKLDLYKFMFYCNTSSDRNPNFITNESLRIELMAGGLNWTQQEYIMDKLQPEPNSWGEISFLDYICYIPLFLSMHDNICDNPLDMSDRKYMERRQSAAVQRDMNPLGYPMKKSSSWLLKGQAKDLLDGKVEINEDNKKENIKLLEKYGGLPKMIENDGLQKKNKLNKKI